MKVPSARGLRSRASRTLHSTCGRRLRSMVSSMPGERSAARIGMLGNRARRAVATTPLPAPLSKTLALGADRGDSS